MRERGGAGHPDSSITLGPGCQAIHRVTPDSLLSVVVQPSGWIHFKRGLWREAASRPRDLLLLFRNTVT